MTKPPRVRVEVTDERGTWEVQSDPVTGEEIGRFLLEPTADFAKQLRIEDLEAELPRADAAISRVENIEKGGLVELRQEVLLLLKASTNYDHAVKVRTEYEALTREDGSRFPAEAPESPGQGR